MVDGGDGFPQSVFARRSWTSLWSVSSGKVSATTRCVGFAIVYASASSCDHVVCRHRERVSFATEGTATRPRRAGDRTDQVVLVLDYFHDESVIKASRLLICFKRRLIKLINADLLILKQLIKTY